MVFHWSLSDSEFPQVTKTLISILVDFSSAGWFQFFPSSSVYLVSFPGLFQGPHLLLVSLSPSCSTAFSVLWQGPGICVAFCFIFYFYFHSIVCWYNKIHKTKVLFILIIIIIIIIIITERYINQEILRT